MAWFLGGLTNYLAFLALGLPLGALPAAFLLGALYLGNVIPTSPGQLGTFHFISVLSLAVFEVAKEQALSYAILLHLVVVAPILLGGAWGLSRVAGQWPSWRGEWRGRW